MRAAPTPRLLVGVLLGACAPLSASTVDRPPAQVLLVTTLGCAPCARVLARLERASRAAAPPPVVKVVVLADDPSDVRAYCADLPPSFACVGDPEGRLARALSVRGLPVLVWQRTGGAPRRAEGAAVEVEIERALAGS